MKTESGWMFIDQAAWKKREATGVADPTSLMLFNVSFSPYDIPTAVRGGIDESNGKFVIEFRYVWPEKGTVRHARGDDHVEFVIGKVSGRLLEIHIDVESAGVSYLFLKSRAMSAVSELSQDESRYQPTGIALEKFFDDSACVAQE